MGRGVLSYLGLFPELTRNTLAFLFPSSCICASLFASLLFGTFSFTLSRSFFSLVLPPTCLTFLLPALPLLLFHVSCQAGTAWVVSWVGGGRSRQSLSASVPLVAFARLFRCCDIYTNQRVRSGVRSQCGWWVVYAVCVRVHACMRACASTHACVSPPPVASSLPRLMPSAPSSIAEAEEALHAECVHAQKHTYQVPRRLG